jgi:hypothetical protein
MTPEEFKTERLKTLPLVIKQINSRLANGQTKTIIESILIEEIKAHYGKSGWRFAVRDRHSTCVFELVHPDDPRPEEK